MELLKKDEEYIISLLEQEKKVEAIVFVKDKTGITLKDAKDYTDKLILEKNIETNKESTCKWNCVYDEKLNAFVSNLARQEFEKIELFKFFNNENNPYMEEINVLTIIFDLRSPTMSYEYLKWVIIDLSNLTNQYGYTTDDILKTYWEKWQKNMKRIGKEWN